MPGSVIQERRGLRDRKIRPGGKLHSTRGLPRKLKFEGRARRSTSGGLGKPTTAVHFHTSLLIKLPFQSDLTTDRTIKKVQDIKQARPACQPTFRIRRIGPVAGG